MSKDFHIINHLLDNPKSIYMTLLNNNLQFGEFAKENKNKSIQELAKDYDIEFILIGKENVQKI